MREDDAPESDQAHGSLADGLGQTPGATPSTATDAYGDDDLDDGAYGDGADVGDTADPTDASDTIDDADIGADALEPEGSALPDDASGGPGDPLEDPLAQDASPLEGIGYLLEELRDAVFGDDGEDAASAFAPDPADLASRTDLDLTGDGVVDPADLHEAESPFDFDVDGLHDGHPGHDGGVIDA